MGERDAVWQEPGYNGLCNYAQKITSCFGLDGKTQGKEEEWGVDVDAGCRNTRGCEMFGMYLDCDADFPVRMASSLVFLSMYALICECVGSCVKATTWWMKI